MMEIIERMIDADTFEITKQVMVKRSSPIQVDGWAVGIVAKPEKNCKD
jgi:hypothetical protein